MASRQKLGHIFTKYDLLKVVDIFLTTSNSLVVQGICLVSQAPTCQNILKSL